MLQQHHGDRVHCDNFWMPANEVAQFDSMGHRANPYESDTTDLQQHRCVQIDFPGKYMGMTHLSRRQTTNGPVSWMGSLVQDAQDASGLMYRRNRQYDPTTGRFTQEDPIGLAGGLNSYGFAEGDPVSFGDPYGLCIIQRICDAILRAGDNAFAYWANRSANADSRLGRGIAHVMGTFAALCTSQTCGTTDRLLRSAATGNIAEVAREGRSALREASRPRQVYHRRADEPEIDAVIESSEVWGAPPRNFFNSDFPKVKAFIGPLPAGTRGYEFTTDVEPTSASPAWAYWGEGTEGVRIEDDMAKIPVTVTKVQR